jgi:hypothetical protein
MNSWPIRCGSSRAARVVVAQSGALVGGEVGATVGVRVADADGVGGTGVDDGVALTDGVAFGLDGTAVGDDVLQAATTRASESRTARRGARKSVLVGLLRRDGRGRGGAYGRDRPSWDPRAQQAVVVRCVGEARRYRPVALDESSNGLPEPDDESLDA